MIVRVPIRPINMDKAITILLSSLSDGVMPRLNPTVDRAEICSKARDDSGKSGSRMVSRVMPTIKKRA